LPASGFDDGSAIGTLEQVVLQRAKSLNLSASPSRLRLIWREADPGSECIDGEVFTSFRFPASVVPGVEIIEHFLSLGDETSRIVIAAVSHRRIF
jgi:hypothetical protein